MKNINEKDDTEDIYDSLGELTADLPPIDVTDGFEPFPSEVLLEEGEPGKNELTGKIFYLEGFASENIGTDLTLIDVLVLEDFGSLWATILLHVPDDNQDWNNEEGLNEQHTFFFQYLGFSEEYNRYIGIYIFHEPSPCLGI